MFPPGHLECQAPGKDISRGRGTLSHPGVGLILTLLTGTVAGAAHVVLAPDHLAALAPLSVEAGRRAWQVGLRWGVGHAAGIAVVGSAARLASERLDLALLWRLGGYGVGLTLVAIGLWGFLHVRRHTRASALESESAALQPHVHTTAAFVVGTVHGVAGTGALLGVVPVLGLPGAFAAAYLLGFAVGTIGAMVAAAALLGLANLARGPQGSRAYRRVFLAASAVALGVGVLWLVRALLGAG